MNIMSFMCSIIVRCHALVLAYLLVNILAPFIHCVWQKRLVYERRFFMLWIFFSIACAMLHVQLSNSYAAVNGTLCCLPPGHAGVIEALCRREVYVLDLNDCAVEESSLTSTHPFHTVSWTALCKCQISVCALWEAATYMAEYETQLHTFVQCILLSFFIGRVHLLQLPPSPGLIRCKSH